MNQIPKILHFIWFGYMPNYVNFCIDNYKKINPDFKINFVHRTPKQLEQIYFENKIENEIDQIIYDIIKHILNKTKYKTLIDVQQKFLNLFGHIPFLQLLSDIFRLEVLNIYGGIYLDCDTFPIKPFDNYILNLKKFCVYDKIGSLYKINNYFIGHNKTSFWDNYLDETAFQLVLTNNHMRSILTTKPMDYWTRRIKFFKCNLSYNDFTDKYNYIEHYSEFSWGKNKVPKTKFDYL